MLKNKQYDSLLIMISGITTALSFTFPKIYLIVFFSLVPLFYVIIKCKLKRCIIKYTFIFSFSYYIPLLLWMYELTPVLPFNDLINFFVILLGIVFISAIQGLCIAVPFCFYKYLKSNSYISIVTLPALFILGEWLQEHLQYPPFPWARIGVIISQLTPFIQSASIFGSIFISFLVLSFNCCIAYIILNRHNTKIVIRSVSVVISVFIINFTLGEIRINANQIKGKDEVILVQGNYAGEKKWNATVSEMLDEYLSLSEKAITPQTKIIFFPETAIPVVLDEQAEIKEKLTDFTKKHNVTIITGLNSRDSDTLYNSMSAIYPDGTISEPYSKQVLVPFGEYLPFKKMLLGIMPCLKEFDVFSAGKESVPVETSIGKISGVICYESIFPSITRKSILNGAEIISVISNDSWFGNSPALYQHHSHSVMRAVENNRFLVRASNTAVTSVISPNGEILATAKPFVKTALTSKISPITKLSLYSVLGDIPILIMIAVIVIISRKTHRFCSESFVQHTELHYFVLNNKESLFPQPVHRLPCHLMYCLKLFLDLAGI